MGNGALWKIRGVNNEQVGFVHVINGELIVGRSPDAGIFITDLQASRKHTKFFPEGESLMVKDLGSSNGTFVNDKQLQSAVPLSDGDIVRIGRTEFRAERMDSASAVNDAEYNNIIKPVVSIDRAPLSAVSTEDYFAALGLNGKQTTSRSELETKTRHFATLFEISRLIQKFSDPDAMLEACLDVILKVPGGDVAHVLLLDESDGSLLVRASRTQLNQPTHELVVSQTVSNYVLNRQCAVVAPDLQTDLRFESSKSIRLGRSRSILAVPIILEQTSRGLIALSSETVLRKEAEEDLDLLCVAASIIGPALQTLELNKEIEETQREVVLTMGAIGETRSKETGNHVRRVAEYSKLLALQYGLGHPEAELLKHASPMHDIGKVGIPDRVLNKPGKLNAEEWEVMKTHAKLGFDMLNHSERPILKAAAIVAMEHHEKWDGSGYPRGLQGEDIHIFGRITAVADVFDALGSDRCYKKAWPLEQILDLFREQTGRHFDPKLVELLFEHLDEFLVIRDAYQDVMGSV
jgi:HD-GYP domain-containing protein (c-di-GMP phosphodiesterase class II)